MYFQALTHRRKMALGTVSQVVMSWYLRMLSRGHIKHLRTTAHCVREFETSDRLADILFIEQELHRQEIPYQKSTTPFVNSNQKVPTNV